MASRGRLNGESAIGSSTRQVISEQVPVADHRDPFTIWKGLSAKGGVAKVDALGLKAKHNLCHMNLQQDFLLSCNDIWMGFGRLGAPV